MIGTLVTLILGALTGYLASLLMDRATTWFYDRQSEDSRRREQQAAPGGTLVLGGRKLAGWFGRAADDAQAARLGLIVHRALGVIYGIAAAALVANGSLPPLTAGLLVAAAAFLLVDEAAMSLLFTPPPWAYPLETHLRGVVGHLTLGLVLGVLLALAQWAGLG